MGVEGAFFAPTLTTRGGPKDVLADEAFSTIHRPEERAYAPFTADFLLGFNGFASNISFSDVLSTTQDDAPFHLFTPQFSSERPPPPNLCDFLAHEQ
jgi:hypothetical protein